MQKFHIALTDEEASLLSMIDLRLAHRTHEEGHAAYNGNKGPILALVKSPCDRGAVPEERRNQLDCQWLTNLMSSDDEQRRVVLGSGI